MMFKWKKQWLQLPILVGLVFGGGASHVEADIAHRYAVRITVLPERTSLIYPQPIRLDQVLNDAYELQQNAVYPLGSALIDPHKQPQLIVEKRRILNELRLLRTPEAINLASQLRALRYAFHESVEMDIAKVRGMPKYNPLLKQEYWVSLPVRPDYITVVDPNSARSQQLPFKANAQLRDYMADLAVSDQEVPSYQSVWVIQADRSIKYVQNLQWQAEPHFISPGALVYIGLENLPDDYRELNANIARLLANRLEL